MDGYEIGYSADFAGGRGTHLLRRCYDEVILLGSSEKYKVDLCQCCVDRMDGRTIVGGRVHGTL